MSVHTKKPLTKIAIGEETFNLPARDAKAVLRLVKSVSKAHHIESVSSDTAFKKIFGDSPRGAINLKASRAKENMSQKSLAQKTGIDSTQISKYENGEREISIEAARKFAKTFKTTYKIYLEKKI